MDAGGTRLPTPGAFTGKFQEILEGADSWSEVSDRLQGQTITYFDFETTGISDYDGQDVFNDPVQLGAVQVKDGKIVKRFNMYVNPESRLSDWSANNLKRDVLDENGDIVLDENGKPTTTLVTPEWLAQQPSQKEALDAFIEFIGPDALLGGQNVPFDVEILKRMADKYETPLSIAGTIDSKDLASLLPKYDPEKGIDGPKAPDRKTGEVRASSSLGPVANFLGFEPANWHSADGDAEDSYNLVSKLISRAAEENNSNLSLLDFDAMQERYNERMAEFKQVVSGDNPITEAQEKALGSMAESTNPEVAELAREALANKSTRGAAAEALSKLHALENAAVKVDASEAPLAEEPTDSKAAYDKFKSQLKGTFMSSDVLAESQSPEVREWVKSHFTSEKTLTPEMKNIRAKYIIEDDNTIRINKELRDGIETDPDIGGLDTWTTSESVTDPVRVYRGLILSPEAHEKYQVGSKFVDKAYSSVAVNRTQILHYFMVRKNAGTAGDQVEFRINLDVGQPMGIADMGEIVLPRNSEFEVLKRTEPEPGRIVLEIRPLPLKTSKIDKASSSSGKKYDVSNIQWNTKAEDVIKKPEPTPDISDDSRSWPALEELLTEVFRYFPTAPEITRRFGNDGIGKIKAARIFYKVMAEEGDPEKIDAAKKKYISAIQDIMDKHLEAFERSFDKYANRKYQALGYKPDGILDNKDVALLLSKYRMIENDPDNRAKQPAETKTVAEANKEQEARILREVPEISSSLLSSLEGSWTIAGRSRILDMFKFNLEQARVRLVGLFQSSISDAEAGFIAEEAKRTFYYNMWSKQNLAAFRDIVDDRGNVIRVYRNPRGNGITATDAEIKIASSAFRKIRERIGSDKKPVTLSFTAVSSILPIGRVEKTEPRTLGFAFKGGDAHVIPARTRTGRLQTEEYNPNTSWHSNNYSTYEEKLEHTIIHEYGHVMMYKYWGDNDNNLDTGAIALNRDYETYGVKGQVVSNYGKESASEHFAEAFAKYIITGDATPEFLNLLRSKGLLKSQQEN